MTIDPHNSADSQIRAIHSYLDAIDLQLLQKHDWAFIRDGLAAATGIRVADDVWETAIAGYVSALTE